MVVIPRKALSHTSGAGDHVWVVDPASGRVARRQITAGELLPDDRITVRAGLAAGETVAVSGLRFLNEDQIVAAVGPSDGALTAESPRP